MEHKGFMPSETARLVLGYLKSVGCPRTWETFLDECSHLKEYAGCLHSGRQYATKIGGRSLLEILEIYCEHVQSRDGECTYSEDFSTKIKALLNQLKDVLAMLPDVPVITEPRPSDAGPSHGTRDFQNCSSCSTPKDQRSRTTQTESARRKENLVLSETSADTRNNPEFSQQQETPPPIDFSYRVLQRQRGHADPGGYPSLASSSATDFHPAPSNSNHQINFPHNLSAPTGYLSGKRLHPHLFYHNSSTELPYSFNELAYSLGSLYSRVSYRAGRIPSEQEEREIPRTEPISPNEASYSAGNVAHEGTCITSEEIGSSGKKDTQVDAVSLEMNDYFLRRNSVLAGVNQEPDATNRRLDEQCSTKLLSCINQGHRRWHSYLDSDRKITALCEELPQKPVGNVGLDLSKKQLGNERTSPHYSHQNDFSGDHGSLNRLYSHGVQHTESNEQEDYVDVDGGEKSTPIPNSSHNTSLEEVEPHSINSNISINCSSVNANYSSTTSKTSHNNVKESNSGEQHNDLPRTASDLKIQSFSLPESEKCLHEKACKTANKQTSLNSKENVNEVESQKSEQLTPLTNPMDQHKNASSLTSVREMNDSSSVFKNPSSLQNVEPAPCFNAEDSNLENASKELEKLLSSTEARNKRYIAKTPCKKYVQNSQAFNLSGEPSVLKNSPQTKSILNRKKQVIMSFANTQNFTSNSPKLNSPLKRPADTDSGNTQKEKRIKCIVRDFEDSVSEFEHNQQGELSNKPCSELLGEVMEPHPSVSLPPESSRKEEKDLKDSCGLSPFKTDHAGIDLNLWQLKSPFSKTPAKHFDSCPDATPEYSGSPTVNHRKKATPGSPRYLLFQERTLAPSLTTPVKDISSMEDRFYSPRRKSLIPRKRLMSGPSPGKPASDIISPVEDFNNLGAVIEELLNLYPLHEKIAENINKVAKGESDTDSSLPKQTDEPAVEPENSNSSSQEFIMSDSTIKDILAKTESDPVFEEVVSVLCERYDTTRETTEPGSQDDKQMFATLHVSRDLSHQLSSAVSEQNNQQSQIVQNNQISNKWESEHSDQPNEQESACVSIKVSESTCSSVTVTQGLESISSQSEYLTMNYNILPSGRQSISTTLEETNKLVSTVSATSKSQSDIGNDSAKSDENAAATNQSQKCPEIVLITETGEQITLHAVETTVGQVCSVLQGSNYIQPLFSSSEAVILNSNQQSSVVTTAVQNSGKTPLKKSRRVKNKFYKKAKSQSRNKVAKTGLVTSIALPQTQYAAVLPSVPSLSDQTFIMTSEAFLPSQQTMFIPSISNVQPITEVTMRSSKKMHSYVRIQPKTTSSPAKTKFSNIADNVLTPPTEESSECKNIHLNTLVKSADRLVARNLQFTPAPREDGKAQKTKSPAKGKMRGKSSKVKDPAEVAKTVIDLSHVIRNASKTSACSTPMPRRKIPNILRSSANKSSAQRKKIAAEKDLTKMDVDKFLDRIHK